MLQDGPRDGSFGPGSGLRGKRVEGFLAGLDVLARTLDSGSGKEAGDPVSAGFDASRTGEEQARTGVWPEASDAVVGEEQAVGGAERPLLRWPQDTNALDQLFSLRSAHRRGDPYGGHRRPRRGRRGRPEAAAADGRGASRDTLAQLADDAGRVSSSRAPTTSRTASPSCSRAHRRFYVLAFEPADHERQAGPRTTAQGARARRRAHGLPPPRLRADQVQGGGQPASERSSPPSRSQRG